MSVCSFYQQLPRCVRQFVAGFVPCSPFYDLILGIASMGHQDFVVYPMGYGQERAAMQ